MESLFFNLGERKYKKSSIGYGLKRVDISQGLLYLDVNPLKKDTIFKLDYIDAMATIFVVKRGEVSIKSIKLYTLSSSSIAIFSTKEAWVEITFKAKSEVFVLFVADFYLRDYLDSKDGVVNMLYSKVQKSIGLEQLCSCSLDTTISYLLQRVLTLDESTNMLSLKAEVLTLELLIQFLQLLKFSFDGYSNQEFLIANRARELLNREFINPPTIKELAKLCQTNDTKLKRVFKKIFRKTIYSYIQDLRLKKAYYLLSFEGLRVTEACRAVGYLHQGNFAKLFKEKFGVEPSVINKNPILAKKC